MRLLDVGFFRVGGEEYMEENGSFGLATILKRHVPPAATVDTLRELLTLEQFECYVQLHAHLRTVPARSGASKERDGRSRHRTGPPHSAPRQRVLTLRKPVPGGTAMWDSRDDVILTEAERKVLADLEAAATRRLRPQDLWARVRARPCTVLIVSVIGLTLSLCLTTLTFASSLGVGVVGSLFVLASLAGLYDSSTAFAEARARRRSSAAEQLRRGNAKGDLS